jgi:phosphatidylserine/phosphatidylglycerophosphate/cardiolipin synthase-like enzyme
MNIIKKVFVAGVAGVLGIFIGYDLAGPITAKDFTVLYSLDKRQNDLALIGAIDGARQYVYFAIYEFTKENIADALIRAKERGLDVQGIMDASQSQNGAQANIVKKLEHAGISIEFQRHEKGIMHLKVLVTDHSYALGSYNWTSSATTLNDEILEIGTAEPLRQEYLDIIRRVLAVNR